MRPMQLSLKCQSPSLTNPFSTLPTRESFFVRHAYFLGANDHFSALKTALKTEINCESWATLKGDISRPCDEPKRGKIAVKIPAITGDEVMKSSVCDFSKLQREVPFTVNPNFGEHGPSSRSPNGDLQGCGDLESPVPPHQRFDVQRRGHLAS